MGGCSPHWEPILEAWPSGVVAQMSVASLGNGCEVPSVSEGRPPPPPLAFSQAGCSQEAFHHVVSVDPGQCACSVQQMPPAAGSARPPE